MCINRARGASVVRESSMAWLGKTACDVAACDVAACDCFAVRHDDTGLNSCRHTHVHVNGKYYFANWCVSEGALQGKLGGVQSWGRGGELSCVAGTVQEMPESLSAWHWYDAVKPPLI